MCIFQAKWDLTVLPNPDIPQMGEDGGMEMLWRELGLGKINQWRISPLLLNSASEINMASPSNIIFVTTWRCSVISKKMLTSAKITNFSNWMFFIKKFQIIIYIFPNFHAHSILDLLLEDKIHHLCITLNLNLTSRSILRILPHDHYVAVT